MARTRDLVTFRIDEQLFAVDLSLTDRVLPNAALTPLPGAPDVVLGALDVHGTIFPVLNVRERLGFPKRPSHLNDSIILARSRRRPVGLLVDAATGIIQTSIEDIVDSEAVLPELKYVSGLMRLEGGLMLIHDLDRFLFPEEEAVLEKALREHALAQTSV